MTGPKLSIVIPAYNCGHSISTIIKSILKQTFRDFELIVINDKSTDNTAAVLDKLARQDKRIKIVNQAKNGGAAVARNAGIDKARGQFIMFFDADDDLSTKSVLSQFIYAIESDGRIDLVVSGMTVRTIKSGKAINSVNVCTNSLPSPKKQEPFKLYILRLLGLDGRLYQVWNKIYRTEIIRNHNLQFQPGINFGEDLIFNLNYFTHMSGSIKFILMPLYIYNQSLDAGTFSKSSLDFSNRLQNYNELTKFIADLPSTIAKISLLSWIRFYWFYSFTLSISSSSLSKSQKILRIKEACKFISNVPISDSKIIGKKKATIEKALQSLSSHPKLLINATSMINKIRNSPLTAGFWQKIKS